MAVTAPGKFGTADVPALPLRLPETARRREDHGARLVLPATPERAAIPAVHPSADPRRRFARVAIVHYWLGTMRGGGGG
ncbi:hypothetical protein, partial [Novosphingobium sp. B-7]|uniref:hypothetical protein n=1 Tax=Novosphingobium sp. B-7 TaxID=1298855 RepID=UPI00192A8B6D